MFNISENTTNLSRYTFMYVSMIATYFFIVRANRRTILICSQLPGLFPESLELWFPRIFYEFGLCYFFPDDIGIKLQQISAFVLLRLNNGLFRPTSIEFVSKCRQGVHLRYDWVRQTFQCIYNHRNWRRLLRLKKIRWEGRIISKIRTSFGTKV